MSLLTVDGRGKPHIYKVEVDAPTAEQLRLYALYSNNTTVEKVCQATLKHTVEKLFPNDEKFQAWKQNPDNLKPPEPRRRKQNGHQPQPAAGTGNGASTALPPNAGSGTASSPKNK